MTTLRDIANEAGVSIDTVSRVLSGSIKGKRKDALERAARIQSIAERLNYRTNYAAQAMGRGCYGSIGILLSTKGSHSVLTHMIGGIQEAVHDAGVSLRFCYLPDDEIDAETARSLARELAVDGLLINYTHEFPPQLLQFVETYRLPIVWLNAKRTHDCVHADDFGAAAIAVREFRKNGHEHIGYLTHPLTHTSHYNLRDRHDGYIAAMAAEGLDPDVHFCELPNELNRKSESVTNWLSGTDRPTAVVTRSGYEGMAVVLSAFALGLSIPGDLSLVPITDGGEFFGISGRRLCVPGKDVGSRAVALLQKKIENPKLVSPPVVVPFQYIGDPASNIGPVPTEQNKIQRSVP